MTEDKEQEIAERLAAEIDAKLMAIISAGSRSQPQRALMARGDRIVSVPLDEAGNVIKPCPKCGPILLCAKHMAMVT